MITTPRPKHQYRFRLLVGMTLVLAAATPAVRASKEALLDAARRGDLSGVKKALDSGVDVNAKTDYGVTALTYAAEKGYTDIAKLLIDRGADVDVQDTFFSTRAINWAARNNHTDVVKLLLTHGATLPQALLKVAISRDQMDLARVIIESGKVEPVWLQRAMESAQLLGNDKLIRMLKDAGVQRADVTPTYPMTQDDLRKFEGTYVGSGDARLRLVANFDGTLTRMADGMTPLTWRPVSPVEFQAVEYPNVKVNFGLENGRAMTFDVFTGKNIYMFNRAKDAPPGASRNESSVADAPVPVHEDNEPVNKTAAWPAFRGYHAGGVADGQHPPITWDVETGEHIRWKTPIPGLAHSSPIVWGDYVFVTTAVSTAPNPTFRPGRYGDVDSAEDKGSWSWRVYCLDKATGRVDWNKVAHEGVPRSRRHIQGSYANATPVTDGKHVVAYFGSEGLYCYDMAGTLKWKVDVGKMDEGWFFDPSYQWGQASSPILYENMVIIQADRDKNSFIAAYNIEDGKVVWRTAREELPSWGTPTIFEHDDRAEVVTNATKFIRGYDIKTGKELWRLGRNSEITVATPVAGSQLVYITGGYAPIWPVYAVKAGATGDITLEDKATSNDYVAWFNNGAGGYMPTPLLYRNRLLVLNNNGILTSLHAETGEQLFRSRVGAGAGATFAASPVAADGRVYFTSEDGDVFVARCGTSYHLMARNQMNEVCMATPAISDGMIFIRTLKNLYGIGAPGNKHDK